MPCKYCYNANHPISECNSPRIEHLMDRISIKMLHNPLNFRYQIEQLKLLRQPELSIICKNIGRAMSGNKVELIYRIINTFFYLSIETAATEQIRNQLFLEIHIIYERMIETVHIDNCITINIIQMLDGWYWYTYGLMRNGLSVEEYSLEVQQLMLLRSSINSIQITTQDQSQSQPEDPECVICYDSNPNEQTCKLGCGHKFCIECVIKIAQVNKKCALCREDIKIIETKSEIEKEQLSCRLFPTHA